MAQENSSHHSHQNSREFKGREKFNGNQGRYGGDYYDSGAFSGAGGRMRPTISLLFSFSQLFFGTSGG
jgi:hypothetical protein